MEGPRFGSAWRRARLTVDERIERGRRARVDAPRSSHGPWESARDRPDPIALLEEQAASRVADLTPIRHGRMLVSPFTFFRGAALIMAADLAHTPSTGITVQLCGDAHLSNFGVFGTPERRLVFDVNDFDETLPGPWEWDVKRLVASLEIAGRDREFSSDDRRAVVLAGVAEYRKRMRALSRMNTLDVWYEHLDAQRALDEIDEEARRRRVSKRDARRAARIVAKAYTRDSVRVLARRTDSSGGEPRIVGEPPLVTPIEDLEGASDWAAGAETIKSLLAAYRETLAHDRHPLEEFRYVHAARRVVGVGSVGTRCYIVLLVGRDNDDPLFLQVKEAQESVLERFVGRSEYTNHGERVVTGQRLMQAASDIFLGWVRITGDDGTTRDYYLRQFHDWKGSVEIESLSLTGAMFYARMCGATLARAHARFGDRVAIAAYLGAGDSFDRAMSAFAAAYADQNERDYEALVSAVASGRLQAISGM